jgi:hypothetical protein
MYSTLFKRSAKGQFTYIHSDGTETMIVISNKVIYTVDTSAGTKTQIGTLTGEGECYAVNAAGKLWIVNGTDFVKIENDLSVYRVQIVAPTGTSATGVNTGGSLAAGVYGVYVAYARVNSAGQYFYSLPYQFTNVTITGSTGLINFVVPASTDTQVTHKVVFMTNADGAVPYFYGVFTNATLTFTISDTTTRNESILMSTASAANQILPITPDSIFLFNDSLFVWDKDAFTVYWSLKTDVNPFDMERFLASNFRTLSLSINAVFSTGGHLHFNHTGNGISTAINGDMSAVIKRTDRSFWYLDCKTPEGRSNVCMYRGRAFGLTNDGFRFYYYASDVSDNFSEDVSFHIKPDVNKIYVGLGVMPCAIINRRSGKRTEYRFSYCNTDYSSQINNDQRIFNLDFANDGNNPRYTWECWENGFAGMVIYNNTWYGMQNGNDDKAQIVKESGVSDLNCYSRTGAYLQTKFLKQFYIFTRMHIDNLETITVWGTPYGLATCSTGISGYIILFDLNYRKFSFTIAGINNQTTAILPSEESGLGLVLPFIMLPQYPTGSCDPISFEARSNSVAIELSYQTDDEEFFLYKMQLPRAQQVTNNMT